MIAQILFNKLQKSNDRKIFYKALLKFRELIIKYNPETMVNFIYYNYTLRLPFSHDYPFNLKREPQYSQNLGVIASVIKKKYPHATAIDVGANIGDSALIINHFAPMPVLCVEGNSKFLPLLKRNTVQIKDISIAECFLGEIEEQVIAVNYLGTSRLEKSSDGILVQTMKQVLEQFSSFGKAKILKIDTDGFDNKIIRASKDYLINAKPILFFEYDPRLLKMQNENAPEIFTFLNKIGYQRLLIFNNLGHLLSEVKSDQEMILMDLTNFYHNDQNGGYMDICAVHPEDEELISDIKNAYSL
jgi:FkbM family methyltransferase